MCIRDSINPGAWVAMATFRPDTSVSPKEPFSIFQVIKTLQSPFSVFGGLKKIQGQAISQSHDSKYVPLRFHLVAVVIASTPFISFWRLGWPIVV